MIKMSPYFIFSSFLIVGMWSTQWAHAQVPISFYDYARPTLDWYSIETDHFNVIFHMEEDGEGSSRTARVTARIAEEIYGPITELYQHSPDTKVSIILKDFEDYSNGAAYFFDNKIEIWAPSLDTPLRGDHNWLRNVITHEFTHIVQVQKSMKMNRKLPFFYFQLLDYENVRRPDVLYGYPNVIITYPVTILNNPAWLAEGTAQYQREWLHYDKWDSHRDMLLRTRVLANEELSLDDMGGFYSHNSLLRETVYNQGYAFTRYLAKRFGEEVLMEISAELGNWENWNVERAIKKAVGIPGNVVYQEWIDELRAEYQAQTSDISVQLAQGEILEEKGFSNFYAQFSPAGDRLAYVSNKDRDFNFLSLYVKDLNELDIITVKLDEVEAAPSLTHTCGFGHKIKSGVGRSFTWHPDGQSIVYVRRKDSPEGYLHADLYQIDLQSRDSERLTTGLRATSPAFDSSGEHIAYVGHEDGSTNLFVYNTTTKDVTRVTHYQDGTQVTDPVWHPSGDWIYFGYQGPSSRDIYKVRVDGSSIQSVVASEFDERNPTFDESGDALYFSSDKNGIFNIYRLHVEGSGSDGPDEGIQQLTNVLGGAFMPSVYKGQIAYSHYEYDGYRIAMLKDASPIPTAGANLAYKQPSILQKPERNKVGISDSVLIASAQHAATLNSFDDRDVRAFTGITEQTNASSSTEESEEEQIDQSSTFKPYTNEFTSFSFYPVIRLDQYVSRRQRSLDVRLADRGRFETLLRNTKVGVLMSSREVLEGLTIFGGLLVAPTSREASSVGDFFAPSRLVKLERDFFFQFDYTKGLSFIPKRWSPQLSLEVFNIRRNVDNGLTIEEFPCTACFPDTTLADLSYNLWEAGLVARSKVTRNILIEGGYRYSPYSVTTERFFSKESDAFIDAFTSRYYIGSAFHLTGYFEWLLPHRHSDVLPVGLRVEASFEREFGRLLDRFDLEDGILEPIYERYRVHRVSFDSKLSTLLPGRILDAPHGVSVRTRFSTILGSTVDDFFNDFVGGLIGARGYPFYALGGNETLWLQGSYTFPIVPRINRQLLFTYVDKVYGRVYADMASAWNGPLTSPGALRKDIGGEIRLGLGSFYLLPTAVFVSATYGLDSFSFALDEGFVTPDGESAVRYGNAWQWHFGVLFGFDL